MLSDAAPEALLLAVFEVFDALLVGDDDVGHAVHGVRELAEAFVVLDLGGGDEFHSLGERFVALGEPVEASCLYGTSEACGGADRIGIDGEAVGPRGIGELAVVSEENDVFAAVFGPEHRRDQMDGVQGPESTAERAPGPTQDSFRKRDLVHGSEKGVQFGGAQGEVLFGKQLGGAIAMQSPPDFHFQQFTRNQIPSR